MLAEKDLPFLIVIADWEFVGETKKWLRILTQLSESLAKNTLVAIQVRVKNVSQIDYQRLAEAALGALGPDTRTVLNGSPDHAQRLGFWGAHVPAASDINIDYTKHGLEFVSTSAHDLDQLASAQQENVSAVLCSPIFQPYWKDIDPIGLQGLRQMSDVCAVPLYALGGITPTRCNSCLKAGALGVAVLSGIMGAKDPNRAINEFLSYTSPH